MKKIFGIICAIVMSVANVNAQEVETSPFEKVVVSVASRVKIVEGEKYGINVRSTDKGILDDIRYTVEDGVLCVTNSRGYDAIPEDETLVITITCPTNVDLETSHYFDALDVKTTPSTDEIPAPSMPPFRFIPHYHHHNPIMTRPWSRA